MHDVGVVVLERATDDPELVRDAYDAVLAPSFSPDELPALPQMMEDFGSSTVVVATRGGTPIATAVTDHAEVGPIALLSYLAVRADERGTGIGSVMMSALDRVWAGGHAHVVLGEVHDPRCWPADGDEQPEARLRFYERHGARLLAVPWVQPRLRPEGGRVEGMLLLVLGPTGGPGGTPEDVPSTWLRQWIHGYFEVEEDLDPDRDPTVAALHERVTATDPVPILPLASWSSLPLLGV